MSYRVVMLGSGSRGNSLLVAGPHARVLIDLAFSERRVANDLAALGLEPRQLHGLFITHTHTDHISGGALRFCFRHGVPLVAPRENLAVLRRRFSATMGKLDRAGLLRDLPMSGLSIHGLEVQPFEVPHDADGLTVGYRLTLGNGSAAPPLRAAVATDLGSVPPEVLRHLADANVLVLEANHDVRLLETSGRPQLLIDRILGPAGHLANAQAAQALEKILSAHEPGFLRSVTLAHLSRECNEPRLALAAARKVLKAAGSPAALHVATQDERLEIQC